MDCVWHNGSANQIQHNGSLIPIRHGTLAIFRG
jgi:hypothetical protein